MKKKDIITIVISGLIIATAIYFAVNMFLPKTGNQKTAPKEQEAVSEITGNIDEETLNRLETYKNYGEGSLNNIGKVNPFGPIE